MFELQDLDLLPVKIPIDGEDPRAIAVSADGSTVYVAIFESGNGSTILAGGSTGDGTIVFPPNVVSDPLGPYAGVNPPPPAVGLIVKKDSQGRCMDDNARTA